MPSHRFLFSLCGAVAEDSWNKREEVYEGKEQEEREGLLSGTQTSTCVRASGKNREFTVKLVKPAHGVS